MYSLDSMLSENDLYRIETVIDFLFHNNLKVFFLRNKILDKLIMIEEDQVEIRFLKRALVVSAPTTRFIFPQLDSQISILFIFPSHLYY